MDMDNIGSSQDHSYARINELAAVKDCKGCANNRTCAGLVVESMQNFINHGRHASSGALIS
jgi:hypothetical protein